MKEFGETGGETGDRQNDFLSAAGPRTAGGARRATYRALAEMHAGFEKVIHELGTLSRTSFLRSDALSAIYEQLWQIRAQALREVLSILGERESANAAHYGRLCAERGSGIQPPATLPANGS